MANAATIEDNTILSNPQTIQQWLNLIEQVTGSGTTNQNQSSSSSTTTTSEANDPIKALIAMLIPGATGGIANPQAQALIQAIFTQFKEGTGGLSGIQAAGNAAGVYNSSTQGLLANDAMSRAIAQSAAAIQTGQNNQQQVIAQLLAALGNNSRTVNQTGQTNTATSRSPSSAGRALGAAAGAGLAANALKNLLGAKPGGKTPSSNEGQGSPGEVPELTQGAGNNPYNPYPDDPEEQQRINEGLTAELENGNFVNDPLDPFGIGGYDPNWESGQIDWSMGDQSNENDPFGVGGWDITDFVGGNPGEANGSWDFIEPMSGGGGFGDSSGEDFGESF